HHRFEVGHLIECGVLSNYVKGRARTSHFFRGMIAGALSKIEGGEWDVEEVECVNDGSDKCAFEAKRRR
ncbi:MAG: V4R domain-containing protein, partial [Conexivisphaera sp.]